MPTVWNNDSVSSSSWTSESSDASSFISDNPRLWEEYDTVVWNLAYNMYFDGTGMQLSRKFQNDTPAAWWWFFTDSPPSVVWETE